MKIRSGDDDLFINQAANGKTQLFVLAQTVLPILNQKLVLKIGSNKSVDMFLQLVIINLLTAYN